MDKRKRMLLWLEEQILIFWNSSAKYILPITLLASILLIGLSKHYWVKFDEVLEYKEKMEYKVKAKYSKRASIIVLFGGISLSFVVFRRKKRFYDGF
jgi:Tfp pilus assembly protein PilO